MKHALYEVLKVPYGSRFEWKVQMPKGLLTFRTKKEATRVSETLKAMYLRDNQKPLDKLANRINNL